MGGSFAVVAIKLGSGLALRTPGRTGGVGVVELFRPNRWTEPRPRSRSLVLLLAWILMAMAVTSAVVLIMGSVAVRAALDFAA